MLTMQHLEDQRKKLIESKAAYEKNLAAAQAAVTKFEDELLRHTGGLFIVDQLIGEMKNVPAPAVDAAPTGESPAKT
jgi:hypothetical protein